MSIDIGGSKVPSPHCLTSIFDMPYLEISSMESKSIYFLVMMNVSRNIIRGGIAYFRDECFGRDYARGVFLLGLEHCIKTPLYWRSVLYQV